MASQYTMDQSWNLQPHLSQGQRIQLEEELHRQGQGHNQPQHPLPHPHAALYPPSSTHGQYRTYPSDFSQDPIIQPPTRSQSYGSHSANAQGFGQHTEHIYGRPLSQPQSAPFPQTTTSSSGFYPQPSLPYRQPLTRGSSSPRSGAGTAPPDLVIGGEGGITPPFTSSPMPLTSTFESPVSQGQLQYQQQQSLQFQLPPRSNSPSSITHEPDHTRQGKRSRRLDEEDEYPFGSDTGLEHESEGQDGKDSKAKPFGACTRCKGLKVRCEFKSLEDPCKRCMNAGKECVIPGRKKRRTPPKREHLIAEIRDQAAQIQKLMAQLELTKSQSQPRSAAASIRRSSPGADLLSPLNPSSPSSPLPPPKPDVEEWIAKARESIEAFGGFIGAGGAGMTKGFLVQEDPEDSDSGGEVFYEFAAEDEDGEVAEVNEYGAEQGANETRQKSRSASRELRSIGGTSGVSGASKRESSGSGIQKLVTLPSEASPFGLIANLSLRHRKRRSSPGVENENDVGVANEDFFRPSPTPDPIRARMLSDQRQTPHILTRGIITPDEAEKLFRIFFDNMALSLSLLDPVLYTAQKTCYRSPFLFTVICAIASRYFAEKPELYGDLMHYAQLAAGTALISGQKGVEVCQAYILLSLYPVPARRWEDGRSWLYLGLAIRVATDLNLHLPNTAKPINEQHAREMLNRTRVWLNCFNLDRSTGSQYGKPPIIPNTDFVANHSQDWWNSSEYNLKNFDIHICCYSAELMVMGNFVRKIYSDPNHPTGLNKDADFKQIATETDDELQSLGERWFALLDQTDQTDPQNRFRTGLLRLAYSYSRVVVLAFGLKNNTDEGHFLTRCLAAAYDVINTYINDIGRPAQRIYLRHGPEAQSVFVTFAASFLIKLLQPRFATYLSKEKRLEIQGLVQKVADLLGSPEIAIDDRHGPKLYSRFLKGLLDTPIARVDSSPNGMMSTSSLPHRRPPRKHKTGSERSLDLTAAIRSNSASPTSASEMASADTSHDAFASVAGVTLAESQYASLLGQTEAAPATNIDWFPTPLPFESELLQSMQSVQESVWGQDISLPGFHWMNNMQPDSSDVYMKSGNSMRNGPMFDLNYFDMKISAP